MRWRINTPQSISVGLRDNSGVAKKNPRSLLFSEPVAYVSVGKKQPVAESGRIVAGGFATIWTKWCQVGRARKKKSLAPEIFYTGGQVLCTGCKGQGLPLPPGSISAFLAATRRIQAIDPSCRARFDDHASDASPCGNSSEQQIASGLLFRRCRANRASSLGGGQYPRGQCQPHPTLLGWQQHGCSGIQPLRVAGCCDVHCAFLWPWCLSMIMG